MTIQRFCRYELRTTDVAAARAFYEHVLGGSSWGPELSIVPLPEPARARGAPSHWLGQIGVPDVTTTLSRLVEAGSLQLGPTQSLPGDQARAIVRDPFGTIVGITSDVIEPSGRHVVWHQLHTEDHARALAVYGALFGWKGTELIDLGPERGGLHQHFAWDDSGRAAGAMSSTVRLPAVHPQWLFFFGVTDLEATIADVRARGGLVLPSHRTASGDLVVGCDDPQGAAFGLWQARRP